MAWCQNRECGEEFSPTEVSNGEHCSWECEERANEIEDGEYDG